MANTTPDSKEDRSALLRQMLLPPIDTQTNGQQHKTASSSMRKQPQPIHTSKIRPQVRLAPGPDQTFAAGEHLGPDAGEGLYAFSDARMTPQPSAVGPYPVPLQATYAPTYNPYYGSWDQSTYCYPYYYPPCYVQNDPIGYSGAEMVRCNDQDPPERQQQLEEARRSALRQSSAQTQEPEKHIALESVADKRPPGMVMSTFGRKTGVAAQFSHTVAPPARREQITTAAQPEPNPPQPGLQPTVVNTYLETARRTICPVVKLPVGHSKWNDSCADDDKIIKRTKVAKAWERARENANQFDKDGHDLPIERLYHFSAADRERVDKWVTEIEPKPSVLQITQVTMKILPQPQKIDVTVTQADLEAWPHWAFAKYWDKMQAKKLHRERMEEQDEQKQMLNRGVKAKMPHFDESGW